MKILIACEFSGIVRDAFLAKGHDAWSCDLIPTERPGPHIINDVRNVLCDGWDMMIAHPPCTFLSNAGQAYFNEERFGFRAFERKRQRVEAMKFVLTLYNAPIRYICVENPVGYLNTHFRKPDQIVQPYYFGDHDIKTTCFWLRGLQPLWYWMQDDLFGNKTASERPQPLWSHERRSTSKWQDRKIKNHYFEGVLINNGRARSRTFPGIAQAMADQWGTIK